MAIYWGGAGTPDLKPIQTRYNGYWFRSRLEARWAVFFDTLGVRYLYEVEGFELNTPGGKIWYLPDFCLPEQRMFVEIKPDYTIMGDGIKRCWHLALGLPEGWRTCICIGDPMTAHIGEWFSWATYKSDPFLAAAIDNMVSDAVQEKRPSRWDDNVGGIRFWKPSQQVEVMALCMDDWYIDAKRTDDLSHSDNRVVWRPGEGAVFSVFAANRLGVNWCSECRYLSLSAIDSVYHVGCMSDEELREATEYQLHYLSNTHEFSARHLIELTKAKVAAREARFEHGETPRVLRLRG